MSFAELHLEKAATNLKNVIIANLGLIIRTAITHELHARHAYATA